MLDLHQDRDRGIVAREELACLGYCDQPFITMSYTA